MTGLKKFALLPIDWNLTPEQAVTMYLEWGNNDWRAEYPPVRSKDDYSIYFVVDTWGEKPLLRLIQRNSEDAVDLAVLDLPDELLPDWQAECRGRRGIFAPTPVITAWLQRALTEE